jgi:hypothetical protein
MTGLKKPDGWSKEPTNGQKMLRTGKGVKE